MAIKKVKFVAKPTHGSTHQITYIKQMKVRKRYSFDSRLFNTSDR